MAPGKYDATTPPKASTLDPKVIGPLLVDLRGEIDQLKKVYDVQAVMDFQRAANYLSAAQIFLRSNGLMKRPLEQKDVKRRLLGHWGTCPGLNFAYAHATQLISELEEKGEEPDWLFITGPGHGAPAVLSTLYLEGSFTKFYPDYDFTEEGFEKFVRAFSFPGGFPSHVNAETPGAIHEGGELGYALAVAYGAVMDRPDAVSVVVVGDGEAETGPTAAAWHSHKYLDPATNGAVIPILHINGYKIGERTISGCMDDLELAALFVGYGYKPRVVEYGKVGDAQPDGKTNHENDVAVNYDMAASMRWALSEIRQIQEAARSGNPITKPRWPVILMRTPKGWTGPREVGGHTVEGSWRSHQVPVNACATDHGQFNQLVEWLKSYKPEELFHAGGSGELIDPRATKIVPKKEKLRMGQNTATYDAFEPLKVSDWREFLHSKDSEVSNMKAIGAYVKKIVELNPKSFRIFSPDEITSNKLDACLEITHRDFQWDPETAHDGGRVTEMLSEHTLQGFLQGYTLTGRHGMFPSYEAFLGIVATMIDQYAKYIKMAEETPWRRPVAGLLYIMTSTLWRQEHNGYSHQNPGLIGSFISLPRNLARIYFPADANTSVSTADHCLRSKNSEEHCVAGASVWKAYSTDGGVDPDVVLVGCGVEVTHEVIAASAILRNHGLRVRVVNVNDLLVLGPDEGPRAHPHALSDAAFYALFTIDKPVVVNFHGYPKDIESLLFGRARKDRWRVQGYIEEGTTTSPWSMLRVNHCSRFHLADIAVEMVCKLAPQHAISADANRIQMNWRHELRNHQKYVEETGEDPAWCTEIPEVKGK
ncbi:hypothetical protein CcaverHIS641_0400710 [Cutaneotrichosporon cavernicola]|nr:hypothetical protein CcaverHIS641_0400710 [Cutaneotrichosporon cavernicola]